MMKFKEYVKARDLKNEGFQSIIGRPITATMGALGHGTKGLVKGVLGTLGNAGYGFIRGLTRPDALWTRLPDEKLKDAQNKIVQAFNDVGDFNKDELWDWLCHYCSQRG